MKKLSKLWLVIAIGLMALGSCRKDERIEPQETSIQMSSDNTTLKLSAEIDFEEDNGDLRRFNFKLEDVNGKRIPRPQFNDGDQVWVYTVIKSNAPGAVAVGKSIKWTYQADGRKLVLKTEDFGNSIDVPDFNNDGGTKWYISGMFNTHNHGGGSGLGRVEFFMIGQRSLRGVSGNLGDDLGELNVPYYLGWTELKINTTTTRDSDNSYQEARALVSATSKFRPLGALIAYKFGNAQQKGAYDFTPTGFTVMSNAFADIGTFELDFPIDEADPSSALPTFRLEGDREGYCYMTYKFADEHDAIAHGRMSDKTYYAWVMKTGEAIPPYYGASYTDVKLKGSSSRPETATYRDYTKTWRTDYTSLGKSSRGWLGDNGKIYKLEARATRRVPLPIELVAEYNLAGGDPGFVRRLSPGTDMGCLNDVVFQGVQPDGVMGPLRFSNWSADGVTPNPDPHRNDQSGWYIFDHFIPEVEVIDVDGQVINLQSKYHWGYEFDGLYSIFPGLTSPLRFMYMYGSNNINIGYETLGTTIGKFFSTFSVDPSNEVIYAIRGQKYQVNGNTKYYPHRDDNAFKTAFRYTRVGDAVSWNNSDNRSLETRIIVDVIHLGDANFAEGGKTELETISNQDWWDSPHSFRHSLGLDRMHRRIFPAVGGMADYPARVVGRGQWGFYKRFRAHGFDTHTTSHLFNGDMLNPTGIISFANLSSAGAVRLFINESYLD